MKKLYEGMFLFDSNLATKDWPGLERHVQDLLQRNSAELVYSERWPDRKLSYEIKGCKKGTYYLTYFNAPPDAVRGLRRDCQLSERVLRVFVLYDDGFVEECAKRRDREAAATSEEPVGVGVGVGVGQEVEKSDVAVDRTAAADQNIENKQSDLATDSSG